MLASFVGLGLLIDRGPRATDATLLVAIALGLVGLGLITAALGLFHRRKTRPEPWRPASSLVAAGPYRYTRNPMYLGMTLVGLAVALAFASVPGALLTLLAAFIVDRAVIRREEAYLRRRFGADYDAYRQQVRRWL
jgi:protein-S-isoprenylcysteine O-methyltransferase Ste14